ncbi:hypothetical protein [Flavicella sp.]|uniref:hypothetical protein n=1 Tax=Flavicella sp. TaxID=2957742 RepID=UPI00262C7EF1|nr:hypothetical protein [Flavicella sp.]MDG1804842.1 hypothetical protein [Flavicella sp.]
MKFALVQYYLIFLISFVSFDSLAQGNYKQENYGNRSILLNGNVTGSVSDLGLTYYNPARLALVDNVAFSINAKTYELKQLELTNTFGENEKIKNSSFQGLPSMVAGTFKIPRWEKSHFAYAFISKSRENSSLSYETGLVLDEILPEFPGDEIFIGRVTLNNSIRDEWIGGSWARLINEKFSIGVSGFFSTYKNTGISELNYNALHSSDQVANYNKEISYAVDSYGFFWKIGGAYQTENLELGVNITLPYLEVSTSGSFIYNEFLAGIGSGDDIFIYNNFSNLNAERKTPLSVSFGAGIPIGKHKIHLNTEWNNAIKSYMPIEIPLLESELGTAPTFSFEEERKAVINYGIGIEYYISPKFSGFLSYSSDYSSFEKNANIYDLLSREETDVNFKTDFNHFGFGIDMSIKTIQLILGATYSYSSSEFEQPVDFPGSDIENVENQVSGLQQSRWQFVVGIEIPFLQDEIDKRWNNMLNNK